MTECKHDLPPGCCSVCEYERRSQKDEAIALLVAALKPFAHLTDVLEPGQMLNFRGVYVSYNDAKAAQEAINRAEALDEEAQA